MMNRKIWAVGVAVSLGLGACDPADVTRFNDNPNSPTSAPAPALFTSAARVTTSRFLGNLNVRGWELVAQHLAEVQYPQSDQYIRLKSSYTDGTFNAAYTEELEDFQQVIRAGKAQNAPGLFGPAQVMQSWTFGEMTDIWGDIPYSSALLGDSAGLGADAIQPKYDPQQEIYNGLFTTLGEATAALAGASSSAITLGGADPIYGGDVAKWQKFSNSLRARYAMRIVNVDPTKANAELQAAFNAPGGVFDKNADNAALAWPGDGVYNNPWSDNFKGRDDHRISDRLMTYLAGWSDPRLPVYAMPTPEDTTVGGAACPAGGCYAGAPNALSQAAAGAYIGFASRPGAIFYPGTTTYGTFGGSGASYPSYLMTYAEVAFIQAEAANRGLGGLTPAQAAGFYEAAIRASMEQWGVTDAGKIAAYLARPEVAYKGAQEGLTQIYTQKWIALYGDGIQAWSLFRRTCSPANIHAGPETIIDGIMRRFEYGTTEKSVNRANVDAAVARQGKDDLTTRIWWDSAPENAPTYVANCGNKL